MWRGGDGTGWDHKGLPLLIATKNVNVPELYYIFLPRYVPMATHSKTTRHISLSDLHLLETITHTPHVAYFGRLLEEEEADLFQSKLQIIKHLIKGEKPPSTE